jgi:4-amino-4-deoxy-L-arabinose transferase-like glycosyltransferase
LACFGNIDGQAEHFAYLDGIIYAVLSRNMAEGLGSAWQPHFTETLFPVFYEHPPLAFWLQSLAFRVLGDSVYIEKFYSLATLPVTALLIVGIWHRLVRNEPCVKHLSWLPVLLWLSTEGVWWAYANNLLENTLTVFTTLAVYLALRACERQPDAGSTSGNWAAVGLSVAAGVAVRGGAYQGTHELVSCRKFRLLLAGDRPNFFQSGRAEHRRYDRHGSSSHRGAPPRARSEGGIGSLC